MNNVQEKNNVVSYDQQPYKKVKKGFTIFKRGDIIWAKITPCMQNGKSCVLDNMPTEIGFGSTEFHVLRKKSKDVYMPFIWAIFASDNILKAAQGVFSGSAGQQRVSASFIENFPATIPQYNIQVNMVSHLEAKLKEKNETLKQADNIRQSISTKLFEHLNIKIPQTSQTQYSVLNLETIKANATKRLDPKCYDKKYEIIRDELKSSNFPKYRLSDLILEIVSGDWGTDANDISDSREVCLVLRATEISNKDNIEIREDKAQYRQIEKKKLATMNMEIGDIIIEKSGGSNDQPVGRVIYVDRLDYNGYRLAYSNFLVKIKVNKDLVDPYYLFEYLRAIYGIGLTEVMQNQTNGIRNLIIEEFLQQTIIVPEDHKEIGFQMKQLRSQAIEIEMNAERKWQLAKQQFEAELLGE